MTRRTALWLTAALLGIAATAAVAWAASQVAGQRIGISSAPLSVQQGLAPPAPRTTPRAPAPRRRQHVTRARLPAKGPTAYTIPAPTQTVQAPVTGSATVSTSSPPVVSSTAVTSSSPAGQAITPGSTTRPAPPPAHQHDDGGGGSSQAGGGRDD